MKKVTTQVFQEHMQEWKVAAARLGIYDSELQCIVPGKEANVIWLDEMPQFFQYLLYRGKGKKRTGEKGKRTQATEVENREQYSYDGAIGMDMHLYDFHLLFKADHLSTDMFPPSLEKKVKHGMVSPARKGCQTGPSFLNRLKNLEIQARARGVEGDLMFCTDGHMSRFFAPVFRWLLAGVGVDTCVLGHDLYITPPSATGTCCILDQLFQALHLAYAGGAKKLKRAYGSHMALGRWEATSIMAGIHSEWASEKHKRWAWKKCGFKLGEGGEASTVGIEHCPADQFVVADTIRELTLAVQVEIAPPAAASPTAPDAPASPNDAPPLEEPPLLPPPP